ncbi:hypothetical protein B0H11DRAFT_2354505 [Mycena galericulata]|nr:hypothetical protein B0H11DRAFT_2354505 [Mycena galericulata]
MNLEAVLGHERRRAQNDVRGPKYQSKGNREIGLTESKITGWESGGCAKHPCISRMWMWGLNEKCEEPTFYRLARIKMGQLRETLSVYQSDGGGASGFPLGICSPQYQVNLELISGRENPLGAGTSLEHIFLLAIPDSRVNENQDEMKIMTKGTRGNFNPTKLVLESYVGCAGPPNPATRKTKTGIACMSHGWEEPGDAPGAEPEVMGEPPNCTKSSGGALQQRNPILELDTKAGGEEAQDAHALAVSRWWRVSRTAHVWNSHRLAKFHCNLVAAAHATSECGFALAERMRLGLRICSAWRGVCITVWPISEDEAAGNRSSHFNSTDSLAYPPQSRVPPGDDIYDALGGAALEDSMALLSWLVLNVEHAYGFRPLSTRQPSLPGSSSTFLRPLPRRRQRPVHLLFRTLTGALAMRVRRRGVALCTGGMLTQELLGRYSVIIVDEAHEQTLRTDLLLANLKRRGSSRRNGTRSRSSSCHHERDTRREEVQPLHLQHPVKIYRCTQGQTDYVDAVLRTFFQIHVDQPLGDVLIFLPGREDIESLRKVIELLARQLRGAHCTMYVTLQGAQTNHVFAVVPCGACKCIVVVVATNIVETSVTIPGVRYIVDMGKSKEKRRTRCSAQGVRATRAEPEIRCCTLAQAMLQLLCFEQDIQELELMDTPDVDAEQTDAVSSVLRTLFLLGALNSHPALMPRDDCIPVHPYCVQGARVHGGVDKRGAIADVRHKFVCPTGDHLTLLNDVQAYRAVGSNSAGEGRGQQGERGGEDWAQVHFVNEQMLREAAWIWDQLHLWTICGVRRFKICGPRRWSADRTEIIDLRVISGPRRSYGDQQNILNIPAIYGARRWLEYITQIIDTRAISGPSAGPGDHSLPPVPATPEIVPTAGRIGPTRCSAMSKKKKKGKSVDDITWSHGSSRNPKCGGKSSSRYLSTVAWAQQIDVLALAGASTTSTICSSSSPTVRSRMDYHVCALQDDNAHGGVFNAISRHCTVPRISLSKNQDKRDECGSWMHTSSSMHLDPKPRVRHRRESALGMARTAAASGQFKRTIQVPSCQDRVQTFSPDACRLILGVNKLHLDQIPGPGPH